MTTGICIQNCIFIGQALILFSLFCVFLLSESLSSFFWGEMNAIDTLTMYSMFLSVIRRGALIGTDNSGSLLSLP